MLRIDKTIIISSVVLGTLGLGLCCGFMGLTLSGIGFGILCLTAAFCFGLLGVICRQEYATDIIPTIYPDFQGLDIDITRRRSIAFNHALTIRHILNDNPYVVAGLEVNEPLNLTPSIGSDDIYAQSIQILLNQLSNKYTVYPAVFILRDLDDWETAHYARMLRRAEANIKWYICDHARNGMDINDIEAGLFEDICNAWPHREPVEISGKGVYIAARPDTNEARIITQALICSARVPIERMTAFLLGANDAKSSVHAFAHDPMYDPKLMHLICEHGDFGLKPLNIGI